MPHLWEEEKCEEFEHFWKRLLSVIVNVTSQSGPKKKSSIGIQNLLSELPLFFAGSFLLKRVGVREPLMAGM